MKGSEWADKFFYISPESGPGALIKWKTFPYQRGILDAMTDPTIPIIVVKKSARIGYTLMLGILECMTIQNDPRNMIVAQPTVEDSQGYSKDFFTPMIRDVPVVSDLAPRERTRDSDSTILRKKFPGMITYFIGANSPRGFRRISAGTVLADEISAWPVQAGKEGDQFSLLRKRSEWYLFPKAVAGSTPTNIGECKITELWDKSDQRQYFVPCPHCGEMQFFKWANFDFSTHGTKKKPVYICEKCEQPIPYGKHRWMMERGEWRATAPYTGIVGFYPWAAHSYGPNATWAHIVEEFLNSKDDPIRLKTWVNTWLGEAWEEESEKIDSGIIYESREEYGPDVPEMVHVIVASVDTQDNRLEVLIRGYGADEESYGLEHIVLNGDPAKIDIWDRLDAVLLKMYNTVGGRQLPIMACGIDRGGHHADAVDRFVRARGMRNVFAVIGRAQGDKPIVGKPSKKNKGKIPLYVVNVDAAKNLIMSRLKTAGAVGRIHYNTNFTEEYCKQLTVEQRKKRYKYGQPYYVWDKPKAARNEAIDLEGYSVGTLRIMFPQVDILNRYITSRMKEKSERIDEPQKPPVDQLLSGRNRRPSKRGWVNGWKK